jgi:hypothetical protein
MSLLKHLPSCFKGSLMALGLTLAGNQAQAAPPPPLQTQAPGYQRLAVGEYEVTALFDGYSDLGPTLLKGLSQNPVIPPGHNPTSPREFPLPPCI